MGNTGFLDFLDYIVSTAPEFLKGDEDFLVTLQGMRDAVKVLQEARDRNLLADKEALETLKSLGIYVIKTIDTSLGADSLTLALSAAYLKGVMDGLDGKSKSLPSQRENSPEG